MSGRRMRAAELHWPVVLPALGLLAIGVAFVWSTTHDNATPLWGRQIAFILAGVVGCAAVMAVGVLRLAHLAWQRHHGQQYPQIVEAGAGPQHGLQLNQE